MGIICNHLQLFMRIIYEQYYFTQNHFQNHHQNQILILPLIQHLTMNLNLVQC